MRIAISGTHATGKTTLMDAFSARHPEFVCEPEPYVALQELYGESFAATPSIEDFERQLAYQLEVLTHFSEHDDAMFERSPADFLAYMLALGGRQSPVAAWSPSASAGLARLDLIVFLPLDDRFPIHVPVDEDLVLREEVDRHLREILFGDDLDVLGGLRPRVIEARGSLPARLGVIERALDEEQW